MPWPKSSVPKFGNWEKSEELAYSFVFDKARAEKERFLHFSDNDLSSDQSLCRNSHEADGKKALFSDKARADRERSLPTPGQIKMHPRMHQNGFKNPEAVLGIGASHPPSYNSSYLRGGASRPPSQNRALKGSTFPHERQHVDQAGRGLHETLPVESINAPGMSLYAQNPPTAKIRSSQAVFDASRVANTQRKHAVPKFGNWDPGTAFTADFNKVRSEKMAKKGSMNALHPGAKPVSPLQPEEDLYKSSELDGVSAERKQKRWFRMLCCSGLPPPT